MKNVLFVCTGNTCRSPMAEAIANELFRANGLNYKAFSRGISVMVPTRASENSIKALELLYKLDIEGHISRILVPMDIEKASIILTMTKDHCNYLKTAYPMHNNKIHSLYAYIGMDKDIADPFGQDIAYYTDCARELKHLIETAFLHRPTAD